MHATVNFTQVGAGHRLITMGRMKKHLDGKKILAKLSKHLLSVSLLLHHSSLKEKINPFNKVVFFSCC